MRLEWGVRQALFLSLALSDRRSGGLVASLLGKRACLLFFGRVCFFVVVFFWWIVVLVLFGFFFFFFFSCCWEEGGVCFSVCFGMVFWGEGRLWII